MFVVTVFQKHCEPADTFSQRCGIQFLKLLFKQYKTTFPMGELAVVRHIFRTEEDADSTIKLGRLALSGTL